MKVFRSEEGFISRTSARRPFLPFESSRQQTRDGIRKLARIVRIHGQTGVGRIHDLAAGVDVADEAGSPDAHRLEVDEAEPLATARHGKTTALRK